MAKPHFVTSRYWTESIARAALGALAESGLSVRAFALREGLCQRRLSRWQRTLEKHPASRSDGAGKFVEIHHRAPAQVEVVLRSARILRFASDIDASVLRRLVELLEDASSC